MTVSANSAVLVNAGRDKHRTQEIRDLQIGLRGRL